MTTAWLEEEIKEDFHSLRNELKCSIWRYSQRRNIPVRVVWAIIYSRFEAETGIRLPHGKPKLDRIIEIGKFDILAKIVERETI